VPMILQSIDRLHAAGAIPQAIFQHARLFALRFDAGRFSLYVAWHARFNNDLGHAWLRRELTGCAEDQRSRRRHRRAPASPRRLACSFSQLLENSSRIANVPPASGKPSRKSQGSGVTGRNKMATIRLICVARVGLGNCP
jgi:hypothetical protein